MGEQTTEDRNLTAPILTWSAPPKEVLYLIWNVRWGRSEIAAAPVRYLKLGLGGAHTESNQRLMYTSA